MGKRTQKLATPERQLAIRQALNLPESFRTPEVAANACKPLEDHRLALVTTPKSTPPGSSTKRK
jgi:hypothetical protein